MTWALQVQTVSLLSHLRSNGVAGPFLIVAPLSTLRNWAAEVRRWCPSLPVLEYHGSGAKARQALRAKHMPLGEPSFTSLCPRIMRRVVWNDSCCLHCELEMLLRWVQLTWGGCISCVAAPVHWLACPCAVRGLWCSRHLAEQLEGIAVL